MRRLICVVLLATTIQVSAARHWKYDAVVTAFGESITQADLESHWGDEIEPIYGLLGRVLIAYAHSIGLETKPDRVEGLINQVEEAYARSRHRLAEEVNCLAYPTGRLCHKKEDTWDRLAASVYLYGMIQPAFEPGTNRLIEELREDLKAEVIDAVPINQLCHLLYDQDGGKLAPAYVLGPRIYMLQNPRGSIQYALDDPILAPLPIDALIYRLQAAEEEGYLIFHDREMRQRFWAYLFGLQNGPSLESLS